MKPERRDTPRIPVALEAIVSTSKSGYQRTVTRDVSLDGAFVAPASRRSASASRGSARVVRTAGGGSGVLFEGVDSEAYAALMNLVFSRQAETR
jgi:hypothetical protein